MVFWAPINAQMPRYEPGSKLLVRGFYRGSIGFGAGLLDPYLIQGYSHPEVDRIWVVYGM